MEGARMAHERESKLAAVQRAWIKIAAGSAGTSDLFHLQGTTPELWRQPVDFHTGDPIIRGQWNPTNLNGRESLVLAPSVAYAKKLLFSWFICLASSSSRWKKIQRTTTSDLFSAHGC